MPWRRILGTAAALGVVGAGRYIFLGRMNQGSGPLVAPAPTPPGTPAAETANRAPAASNSMTVASANATTEAVVVTNELIEPGDKPAPEPDARARESLTLRIDKRFPLFADGEQVALRLTNGMVKRGTFGGLSEADVLLVTADSTGRLPVASLDIGTRLRADPDYRVRYVDYWSQRGVKSAPGP